MSGEWHVYRKRGVTEMRPYIPGESLEGVSVSPVDDISRGGMIARDPENHGDRWFVAADYFQANYTGESRCEDQ